MTSLWLFLLLRALLCVHADAQGLSTSSHPESALPTSMQNTTSAPGLSTSSHPEAALPTSMQNTTSAPGLSTSSRPESALPTSLQITTSAPDFTRGSNQSMCEGVRCTWNLWAHYEAKGCKPEYNNGSCCPTHFVCPQLENLNPEKCYLFGKEYNLKDDIPLNGDGDKCFSGCHCNRGFGPRAEIICLQDVGLCWNRKPPAPGCRHKFNPCGGCPEDICDKPPHICSWNNKTYLEGQYMGFGGDYHCHYCICTKNFTGPTGEGCQKSRCGSAGIDVRSNCVDVYRPGACCPSEYLCDDNEKILSVPNTNRESTILDTLHESVSTGMTCTLGKFIRSVGEQLENEDCRINCTCLTPPEFTCIMTRTCLPEVPKEEREQCPYSLSCLNGECRKDCGDLVEEPNKCSGSEKGCKCCRHEKCAKSTGMCRMHCSDGEYENTWTSYSCHFFAMDPKPKCCVKNSTLSTYSTLSTDSTLSTTELGPLETTNHPTIND